MGRRDNTAVTDEAEVIEGIEAPVDETEVVEATEDKPAKAPARPPVPEGFVSPVEFAKQLSLKLGKEIKPQMIYSYIKNANKKDPFPASDQGERKNCIVVEEGFAWWDRKDARVAEQKKNAAEKAAAKEARAAEKAAGATEAEATEPATEVEA